MQSIDVSLFVSESKHHVILDVRSPAEYAHAHIPGAVSLPLFSDEERAVVGTAYVQQSREQAIKHGLDYFGPKMRQMVEAVEALTAEKGNKKVYVHCWRGGMRSGAVAWLLDLYGFEVSLLVGGYKAFRNWVLASFKRPYQLAVVGGYTGTGKTYILHQMQQEVQVIDLEGLAGHKGSALGGIGLPPQGSQEHFENKLAMALAEVQIDEPIWLEDESQRIGNLNIPHDFFDQMQAAIHYFLDVPSEKRLDFLVEEYGKLPLEALKESTIRIKKRLGGLETKNVLAYLEEADVKEAFKILLRYYDKWYRKGLETRILDKKPVEHIKSEQVDAAANAKMVLEQSRSKVI